MMEQGLSTNEAHQRLITVGKNEITAAKSYTVFSLFISQFKDIITAILFIAAIVSFVIGDIIDGTFIFAVIILNGVFGFAQEYRAEKSLEKLK